MYEAERVETLSCQLFDEASDIGGGEISVQYKILWQGPGHDLEWEPLSIRYDLGGGQVLHSINFHDGFGPQAIAWCAKHFSQLKDWFEGECDDFEPLRDWHSAQHRENVLDFQSAVL